MSSAFTVYGEHSEQCRSSVLSKNKSLQVHVVWCAGTGPGAGESMATASSRGDDDESSRESQPPADAVSQKSDSSRDSETASSAAMVTTTTSAKASFTTDVVRLKCREMLTNALNTPCE